MSGNTMSGSLLARRRESAAPSGRSFLLVLFAVFAVVMLVALLVGLQGYRAIAQERNDTDERRLAYGSLVNTVKAFDATDAFAVEEHEGNAMLVMTQRTVDAVYAMRLFVHDGMLMQQYSLPDDAVTPENAHALFATKAFTVDYEDGLLVLATDDATPCIHLMCAQPSLERSLGAEGADGSEEGEV